MYEAFFKLLAVEAYCEAVHLFLNLRKQVERAGVGLQLHCAWREPEQKLVGAVPVVLGQSRDGDFDM